MSIAKKIEEIIQAEFSPQHLEVINESHLHVGHAGHDGTNDSHFKLIIVSDVFDGRSRVARERMVSKSLKPLFESGLHALSLTLYCAEEYLK
jgi:BolA protein